MKSFAKFIEEVTYNGNKGLPKDFIENTQRKASRDYRVQVDDVSQERALIGELSGLIKRSNEIIWKNKDTAEKLVQLAKDVIMSEYESILDNIDLDIKLVKGDVIEDIPELKKVPITTKTQAQQKEELKKQEEPKDGDKDKPIKKTSSLADKLKGLKGPKKDELAAFLNSEELSDKIDKAKLTNAIIQGEGKNTKNLLHSEMVKDRLKDIFGNESDTIFKIWDDTTKIANKVDWAIPVAHRVDQMKQHQKGFAGAVRVDWPEAGQGEEQPGKDGPDMSNLKPEGYKVPDAKSAQDILKNIEDGADLNDNKEEIGELFSTGNPRIVVSGVDFPMLLHEIVKGIYLLIAAAGISSDPKMAKAVKMNVSTLEDEAEDFKYGPYIAAALRDCVNSCKGADRNPNMREFVFGKMMTMSDKPFLNLMKGVLEGTEEAKKTITELIEQVNDEIKDWEISAIPSDEPKEPKGGKRKEPKEEEDEISKLIKRSQQPEEAEKDIKEMTPSELEDYVGKLSSKGRLDLVDGLLDSGDFELLRKVQSLKSMKEESLEWKMYESEIKRILK